eukprot:Filipodium_phascolosomae@DN2270_c0_g1_i1.p1
MSVIDHILSRPQIKPTLPYSNEPTSKSSVPAWMHVSPISISQTEPDLPDTSQKRPISHAPRRSDSLPTVNKADQKVAEFREAELRLEKKKKEFRERLNSGTPGKQTNSLNELSLELNELQKAVSRLSAVAKQASASSKIVQASQAQRVRRVQSIETKLVPNKLSQDISSRSSVSTLSTPHMSMGTTDNNPTAMKEWLAVRNSKAKRKPPTKALKAETPIGEKQPIVLNPPCKLKATEPPGRKIAASSRSVRPPSNNKSADSGGRKAEPDGIRRIERPQPASNDLVKPTLKRSDIRGNKRVGDESSSIYRELFQPTQDDLDFIDDDTNETNDWVVQLRETTGYNPAKFLQLEEDDVMEANYNDCIQEESQSRLIGRREDLIEEEREKMRQEIKRKRLKQ